ncbi:MAG: NADH:flavin oxidoreductase [Victivallaceae bacterium]|jgi:2,4-dienoyl-CoA reductase-like NADH-dependent reductase (Old Yellow Enzyme family)
MATLFEENKLAGITLRNRFVRSATFEGMGSDSGLVKPALTGKMRELAEGGVGLIITGHTYFSIEGKASPGKVAVDRDECIKGLAKMAAAVHTSGGKIVLQLGHAGAMANIACTGQEPIGPSAIAGKEGNPLCREMNQKDIETVIENIAAGARRAKKAGFDGVQIHAAHGYLFSQFLSPFFNKRQDEFGGSVENRTKIVIMALNRIKATTGEGYPVLIKINSDDFIDGGICPAEMIEIAQLLEQNCIDAIEISGGTHFSKEGYDPVRKGNRATPDHGAYYFNAAAKLKKTVKVPVILVGGIRAFDTAENIIDSKAADYIAMSRPLIREPQLVKRWESGNTSRANCESCNSCFRPVLTGKGLYCPVGERLKRQAQQKVEEREAVLLA